MTGSTRGRGVPDVNGDQSAESVEAEVFLQELHDALSHLRDLPFRRSHPLCPRLGHPVPVSTAALQQTLLDAIERLHPPSAVTADAPRARRYHYLKLRYAEGARLEDVIATLGISGRQARREHRSALQELASLLMPRPLASRDRDVTGSVAENDLPGPWPTWDEFGPPSESAAPLALEEELTQLETELPLDPIDPRAAVQDALDLVSNLAVSRSAVIEFLPGSRLPTVVATRTALRQILLNLLGYYINAGSTHHLRISATERTASVDLHFVPVGTDESPDETGSARNVDLAPPLAAACRLAEGQEGSLRIETGPSGVAIHLLLLTARATIALVVDDNPGIVRLFRRYVRGAGFRLVQARNSIRAYELARTLQPDVILLDLMMPVQDGWDLFRSLQHDPTTASIPVVACSILPECELALSLGARDFLAKPVTPESLLAALEPFRRSPRHHPVADGGDGEHPDSSSDSPSPLQPTGHRAE